MGSAFPAVFIHRFQCVCVCVCACVVPRDPPDFHFETGSDFTYLTCARVRVLVCILRARAPSSVLLLFKHCMCVCVCVWNERDKKKNRPLIANAILLSVVCVFRYQTVVGNVHSGHAHCRRTFTFNKRYVIATNFLTDYTSTTEHETYIYIDKKVKNEIFARGNLENNSTDFDESSVDRFGGGLSVRSLSRVVFIVARINGRL